MNNSRFASLPRSRPSSIELMMRVAELVAQRSTCRRSQVGAVVTDESMLQIFGYGYNGNAAGLANTCDSDEPGNCGCVHAELNALLKAPGTTSRKRLFTTLSPCIACAKAIVNARVERVYFRLPYRKVDGLALLLGAGVKIFHAIPSDTTTMWDRSLIEAVAREESKRGLVTFVEP